MEASCNPCRRWVQGHRDQPPPHTLPSKIARGCVTTCAHAYHAHTHMTRARIPRTLRARTSHALKRTRAHAHMRTHAAGETRLDQLEGPCPDQRKGSRPERGEGPRPDQMEEVLRRGKGRAHIRGKG
eukprot:6214620-Pleurochrysis_carterae.AAC.2